MWTIIDDFDESSRKAVCSVFNTLKSKDDEGVFRADGLYDGLYYFDLSFDAIREAAYMIDMVDGEKYAELLAAYETLKEEHEQLQRQYNAAKGTITKLKDTIQLKKKDKS